MNYNGNHVNKHVSFLNKCCVVIVVCVGCFVLPAECSHEPNTSSIQASNNQPLKEEPATDYALTINGQSVFTHRARVSAHPLNQGWPGYQRPLEQTEIASFASWDMDAPVEVSIVSARPVKDVRVRPRSYGIDPKVEGNTIRFTIKKPGQLTVEVNGTHRALHLFANPPQEAAPNPNDPKVCYFGPGVHYPGLIRLKSNQTIYLADGAVVYGAIIAEKAKNITIIGRGILDGSKFDRMEVTGLISLYDCTNVRIDGITLRDPSGFTITPIASRQVHIRNIKLIGNWRYNTDGIDFINCQHCSVEDSFIRSFDDSIVLKGYEKFGAFIYRLQSISRGYSADGLNSYSFAKLQDSMGQYACHAVPMHDIQVRRCVIWNDWGRALEIGAETVANEMSDLLFEDCDIIHTTQIAMDVQNGDRALCRNIAFKNIRVELDDGLTSPVSQITKDQKYEVSPGDRYIPNLIVLEIAEKGCSYDSVRGHIEDIQFKDIEVTSHGVPPSRLRGFDAKHQVQRVSIENLRINGQAVTTLEAGGFSANEFVRDVSIKTENTSLVYSDSKSWDQSFLKFSRIYGGVELDPKWKFMWDPNDEGINKEWSSKKYDDSKWFNIGTDSAWEEQPVGKQWEKQHGNQYDGFGWYRNQFVTSDKKPQRTILAFGAVDEACKVWINGQLVLDRPFPYKGNSNSWQEAFEVDITEYVRYDQPNVLAVRVEDNSGGGGIWRPVKLLTSDAR